MVKTASNKEVIVDKAGLAMYTKRVIERKELEDIAKEYKVSSRTVQRKVAAVIEAVKELAELKAAATKPPGPDGNMGDPPAPKVETRPPKPPVVPGRISREALGQKEAAPPVKDGASAVALRETYAQEITLPETNPLSGIQDMMSISRVGVSAGVIAGSGFVKVRDALTRYDIPLGERALMITQGSTVLSNMLLGLVEAARVFDEDNVVLVDENGQRVRR